jgi:hypothetical protein
MPRRDDSWMPGRTDPRARLRARIRPVRPAARYMLQELGQRRMFPDPVTACGRKTALAARPGTQPLDRQIQRRRLILDPPPSFVHRRTGLGRGGSPGSPGACVRRRALAHERSDEFAAAPWFNPSEEIAIEYHDKVILLCTTASHIDLSRRCLDISIHRIVTPIAALTGTGPAPVAGLLIPPGWPAALVERRQRIHRKSYRDAGVEPPLASWCLPDPCMRAGACRSLETLCSLFAVSLSS